MFENLYLPGRLRWPRITLTVTFNVCNNAKFITEFEYHASLARRSAALEIIETCKCNTAKTVCADILCQRLGAKVNRIQSR